jgi:5-methylthioribose kinase
LQIEAEAMQVVHSFAPAHVPTIYLYDAHQSAMIMQFLPPPHVKVHM